MEAKILDVPLKDGSSNRISVFEAKSNAEAPVVVCFPAMGVAASNYRPLAEELCAQDLIAVTADLRGSGHSSVRPARGVDFKVWITKTRKIVTT